MAVEAIWPVISAPQVVRALAKNPQIGVSAGLTPEESASPSASLLGPGWSTGDLVLLDEALSIVGVDPRPAAAHDAQLQERNKAELEYAQGVLDMLTDSTIDDEGTAGSLVNARLLVQRQTDTYHRTLREKAFADRDWVFGHIVVDEAQDLDPMTVRALVRRCSSRSFTLVGDIHQAATAREVRSWDQVLGDKLSRRRELTLTVNYRNPREFIDEATAALRSAVPELEYPRSIRVASEPVATHSSHTPEVQAVALAGIRHKQQAGRSVAIICVQPASVRSLITEGSWMPWIGAPAQARGLEFDAVIVVEPDAIIADPLLGINSLYVALSRATQTLDVVGRDDALPGKSAYEAVSGAF